MSQTVRLEPDRETDYLQLFKHLELQQKPHMHEPSLGEDSGWASSSNRSSLLRCICLPTAHRSTPSGPLLRVGAMVQHRGAWVKQLSTLPTPPSPPHQPTSITMAIIINGMCKRETPNQLLSRAQTVQLYLPDIWWKYQAIQNLVTVSCWDKVFYIIWGSIYCNVAINLRGEKSIILYVPITLRSGSHRKTKQISW